MAGVGPQHVIGCTYYNDTAVLLDSKKRVIRRKLQAPQGSCLDRPNPNCRSFDNNSPCFCSRCLTPFLSLLLSLLVSLLLLSSSFFMKVS